MKSIILASVIAILFTGAAHAQWIHIGPKLGTNINKLSGKSFKDEFSYGYSAGAFATIKLGNKWALQPEVVFNQSSADTTSQFSQLYKINGNTISNIKLNYLSIPLLLNYNVSKGIALQAGPQYGILLGQNQNLLENGKRAFKEGDFSLLGGIQVKVGAVRVYGRYAVGLNNLNDIDNRDQWKNQSIQLGVGFAIL